MINSPTVESSQNLQYSGVTVLSSSPFNHFCVHHEDTFPFFPPLQLTIPVCFMGFIRISFIWSWSDHVTCLFKIRLHPWFHLGFCAVHLSSSDTKQIKLLVSLQTCPLNFSPCVLTCADIQTVEVYLLSSASSITSFIKTLLISIPTNFWSLQFSHHPHAILCLGYTTFPALCDYNFC